MGSGRGDDLEAWASLARPRTFAVVGLGGAGGDAVHDLVELGIPGVHAMALNTDARHLQSKPIESRILLGKRQLGGGGSGGNRSLVLEAAEEAKEEILRRIQPYEIVFLLAGLGGGTGSALLPYLVRLLRETDALPVPVAFLPFHVEMDTNPDRAENVQATLSELEEMGGLLLALSNEKLRRFDTLPMHQVFHVRNTYLHSLLTSLVDMIESPSQMNVDLASLKGHLRDSGLSTLLYGESHIEEPDRLVADALAESLLDFTISEAPSALLHLDGGSNFTLRSLEEVMRAFQGRLGKPRRIVFGTRMHPERREVVRLTAVVGGLGPTTIRRALGPLA